MDLASARDCSEPIWRERLWWPAPLTLTNRNEHCTYVLCDFSGEKVSLGGGHTDSCNGYPGSARCCVHFDPQQQQQQLFEEWGLLGPDLCHDCGILCEFLKVRRISPKMTINFCERVLSSLETFLTHISAPKKGRTLRSI